MAAPIKTARNNFFRSSGGFTLAEILMVTIMIALLSSLVLPRFIFQGEKAVASEAINVMGALKRGMLQFNDERGGWYAFNAGTGATDVCANVVAVADILGVNASDSCNAGRWTYQIQDNPGNFVITALRGGVAANNLTLTFNKANAVVTWGGAGTFAPNGPNWPNLQ